MSILSDIANRLATDRTVASTRSHRVGDQSLARDGVEVRKIVATSKTIKAKCDMSTAVAVAVVRVLAGSDLVDCATRHHIKSEAQVLAQARAANELVNVLNDEGVTPSAEGLDNLRSTCLTALDAVFKAGKSPYTLLGPNAVALIQQCESVDMNRLFAASTAAAGIIAAAEKAKADAEAAKAARAAKAAESFSKLNSRQVTLKASQAAAVKAAWAFQYKVA